MRFEAKSEGKPSIFRFLENLWIFHGVLAIRFAPSFGRACLAALLTGTWKPQWERDG